MKGEEASPAAVPPLTEELAPNEQSPPSKKKTQRISSAVKSPVPVFELEKESPQAEVMALPPLLRSEKKRPLREVVGGAGAFFGVPTEEASMDKKPQEGIPSSSKASGSSTKRAKIQSEDTLTSAPTSAGQCLEGLKIALTGVMEFTGREELESKVLELGGKVASSVSGRTSLVVAGEVLEDGRPVTESSKYKHAQEKGVKILSEKEFLSFIEERRQSLPQKPTKPTSVQSASAKEDNKANTINSQLKKESSFTRTTERDVDSMLWVDKYRPEAVDDIIGSGDIIRKLRDWLRDWDTVHIKKALKPNFTKENPGAKAVLLSGPPGKVPVPTFRYS